MISPSLSFTTVLGSAHPADVFAEIVNQSKCRFGLQDLAFVHYEDKPRPKTRSSVVSAISLDSVPVKAQPKKLTTPSASVWAFNQEDRHVEGSKRQ